MPPLTSPFRAAAFSLLMSAALTAAACTTIEQGARGAQEGGATGGAGQGGVGSRGGSSAGGQSAGGSDPSAPFEPLFRTDFEPPGASGTPADAHNQLILKNLGNPAAGAFPLPATLRPAFYYEAGDNGDRYARLIEDPTAAGNTVLHYWMRNAVIGTGYRDHTKARIQFGIHPSAVGYEMRRLYTKQRVYLHPDLGKLADYPLAGDPWWLSLTLQELWFGAPSLKHPLAARISLTIAADRATSQLRLGATCDTTFDLELFWSAPPSALALPLGEWLTIEVGYQMGDAKSGRFVVVVDAESLPEPVRVVDVHDYTYNPHSDEAGGLGPLPLTHWQPLKLYTSDNVVHFIRDQGGVAQVYWDDFEFSDSWPQGWP